MNKRSKNRFIAVVSAAITMGIAGGSVMATTLEVPLPDAGDFATVIDNQYWPLRVGYTFAYIAETEDGCEYNKLTITGGIEEITIDNAIYFTLIVRDQEWESEESEECDGTNATLAEDTHDFYAMDLDNNIWYFGEDTWSIDEDTGECTDEGAWLAGESDAEAGIVMLGSPTSGDRYRQEYWEEEAEDWGAVLRLNANVSIDYGDFEACLMTREWTPLEPGEVEHKFYCPQPSDLGPGLMFIEELKGKTVYVEYVGADFDFEPLPGEGDPDFPSSALICTMP
jgi:hypothetical protein